MKRKRYNDNRNPGRRDLNKESPKERLESMAR